MTDGGHLGSPAAPPPPPSPAAGAPRKGLSVGAILGIVFGGLVLLVVVVVVIAVVVVSNVARSSASASAASSSNASAVVRGYLTAVAAGNATKARSYLQDSTEGQSLMTQEVLTASQRIAPITKIAVGKPTADTYYPDVTATYRLGSRPVSAKFHLGKDEDGRFSISSGLANLRLSYLKGLDVTVNGTKVTMPENGLRVFPGAYEIGMATTSLAIDGDPRVDVTGPDSSSVAYDAVKPKLSDAGLATFRRLVAASVKGCLAQRTLKAGCGLSVPKTLSDGIKVDEGSLVRSSTPQLKAKLDHLTPTPDLDTPTLMTASIGESPSVKATGTKNGQHGSFSLLFGPSFRTASIDVSQKDPTVEWG